MTRRFRSLLVAALTLLGVLTAGYSRHGAAIGPSSSAAHSLHGPAGTVVFSDARYPTLPETLNPYQSLLSDDPFTPLLFEPLWSWDDLGYPVPGLAQFVPTFANHLAYRSGNELLATVKLRKEAKWSDGQPLTSDDILFTWHWVKDVNGGSPITSVDTPDPSTAVFHYVFPAAGYLEQPLLILPKHAFASLQQAETSVGSDPKYNYTDSTYVTSGPYIVNSYSHTSNTIDFKPNPNYAFPPPSLDHLVFQVEPSPAALIGAIGKGVDLAGGFGGSDLPSLQSLPAGITPVVLPGTSFDHLVINTDRPDWKNINRRLAIASGVNRTAIIRSLYSEALALMLRDTNVMTPSWTPASVSSVPFDQEKARTLLAQSGYTGQPITLTTNTSSAFRSAEATQVVDALKAVGFNVTIQPATIPQLYGRDGILINGAFDLALVSEGATHDAAETLSQFLPGEIPSTSHPLGLNYSRVDDPNLTAAIDAAQSTMDPSRRAPALNSALQSVLDKGYDVPLFFRPIISIHDSKILNVHPNALGNTWNAAQWGSADGGGAVLPRPDTAGDSIPAFWNSGQINDGITTTGFEFGVEKVTDQWLKIGFAGDRIYRISKLLIDPAATAGHPADEAAKDVEVRVSTTGTADADFSTVFRGTLQPNNALQPLLLKAPVAAKYVQIIVHNNDGNSNFISLSEVQVVGTPANAAAATRASGLRSRIVSVAKKPAALGTVRAIRKGLAVTRSRTRRKGTVKMSLRGHDLLQTGPGQRASMSFRDGTFLHINQRTDILLKDPHTSVVRRGEVDQIVAPGTDHQVSTVAANMSAIGTEFDVSVSGKTTKVVVAEGVVTVSTTAGVVTVKAGQQTTITTGSAPAAPSPVDAATAVSWTHILPASHVPQNIALDSNGGRIVGTSS